MPGAYENASDGKSAIYYPGVLDAAPSQAGKVVVVTGCTTGTGYVVARSMAAKGAKVLMLNRTSARSVKAEHDIREAVPGADVSTIEADLTSFDSVRKACELVKGAVSELDVLCCNAGVMANNDQATADGYDIQMQTNHHSHFLLTKELMPLLEAAAAKRGEARVCAMSSIARFGAPLDAKYLGKNGGNLGGDNEGWFRMSFSTPRWLRYHQTKLANCVFTLALHDRLQAKGSKVKSVVAHPGLAATNLQANTDQHSAGTGMPRWFGPIFRWKAMHMEDGAAPLLKVMVDPGVESGQMWGPMESSGMTGPPIFIDMSKEKEVWDTRARDVLWEESCKAVGDFVV